MVKCDACSYAACTNSAVKIHKFRVHSGSNLWICEYPGCSHRYNDKGTLTKHGIFHETVSELRKPFECSFKTCKFRTARKADLKGHVAARHAVNRTRDFQCPMCKSEFFTQEYLELRIRCHTREKVLQCNVSATTLPTHIRISAPT